MNSWSGEAESDRVIIYILCTTSYSVLQYVLG